MTTPADLQKCFEANSLAPFFALKYAPPAMGKLLEGKGNYPNAATKDQRYGSIIVVSSVASTYGGNLPSSGTTSGCRRLVVHMQNLEGYLADEKRVNRMLGPLLHDELTCGVGCGTGGRGGAERYGKQYVKPRIGV